MINIKVYQNGYEIKGHETTFICYQISLWHWIGSNIILGSDKGAKEYTSERDNEKEPDEGYTWLVFHPDFVNLKWIFDDLVISIERWVKDTVPEGHVTIEHVDSFLEK